MQLQIGDKTYEVVILGDKDTGAPINPGGPGGPGGGGAATIADGADIALGATTATAAAADGAGNYSLLGAAKRALLNWAALLTLQTSISNKLGSAAVTRGTGAVDANTQRVTLATDGPGVQALTSIDGIYAEIIDQPNATTTFICQAAVGAAASASAWRCRRIVVSGTTTVTTWAGGGAFNQVAADRASLTYA